MQQREERRERRWRPQTPARSLRDCLAEAGQALGVMAAFVVLGGLAAWAVAPPAPPTGPGGYPPASMASEQRGDEPTRLWLVDGFNVIQVALLAGRDRRDWWNAVRRAELLEAASRFRGEDPGAELWVVFDGDRPPDSPEAPGGVRVAFAPCADAWVLARLRASRTPVTVVTADRRLAARARRHGASVVSPREFLAACA
jgi:predicted RNA-binding protein with PIN domain